MSQLWGAVVHKTFIKAGEDHRSLPPRLAAGFRSTLARALAGANALHLSSRRDCRVRFAASRSRRENIVRTNAPPDPSDTSEPPYETADFAAYGRI